MSTIQTMIQYKTIMNAYAALIDAKQLLIKHRNIEAYYYVFTS